MIDIPCFGQVHVVEDILVPVTKIMISVPVAIFHTVMDCSREKKPEKKIVKIVTPPSKIPTPEEIAEAAKQRKKVEELREKVGRMLSGANLEEPKTVRRERRPMSQSYHSGFTFREEEQDPEVRAFIFVAQEIKPYTSTRSMKIPQIKKTRDPGSDDEDFFELDRNRSSDLQKPLDSLDDFYL